MGEEATKETKKGKKWGLTRRPYYYIDKSGTLVLVLILGSILFLGCKEIFLNFILNQFKYRLCSPDVRLALRSVHPLAIS
jgi:hypothetical protein